MRSAIYRPAAPDVQGGKSKSKPAPDSAGSWWGGRTLSEHVVGERRVSGNDGGGDAVKLQQAGQASSHSCVNNLG